MSAKKIRQWAWPFIKNFRTYIDVGAFNGDTSAPFVKDFKRVIAFEPSPLIFPHIPDTVETVSYTHLTMPTTPYV